MKLLPVLLSTALSLAASAAGAQNDPPKSKKSSEPTAAETIQAALEYFRVDPDRFDGYRSKARARALLPIVAGGFRYDGDAFVRQEVESPNPLVSDENTKRTLNAVSVGAVWDLRELVFNPAELQVYGLVGVQRDVMLEVTRTYYLRKQLLLRKELEPPADPMAQRSLDLRIEELTSTLDVMTGGWFSETTTGRKK